MHSSSDACGIRTINPHQGHGARGRSTMSRYPTQKFGKRAVSPRLGGPAWPADGAARATTSAPQLQLRKIVGAIADPLDDRCTHGALVLGPQPFTTIERLRAGPTQQRCCGRGKKKGLDSKGVNSDRGAWSDFETKWHPDERMNEHNRAPRPTERRGA
jgi:hypothetical protein